MKTRKATAVLALTLAAGLGITACGGAEDAAKDASDKVSDAVNPGLTDENKEQLGAFIKDFFKTAHDSEMPSEARDDIKALLEKVSPAAGTDDQQEPENISEMAQLFDDSELTDEEKQKVIDYLKELDPLADKFDTDGLTDGELYSLHAFNVVSSGIISIMDESAFNSIEVNTEKVEFGDDTAKTTADSFENTGSDEEAGASSDPSSTASAESGSSSSSDAGDAGLEVARDCFNGVNFKFEDGSWKVDGKSYLEAVDKAGVM